MLGALPKIIFLIMIASPAQERDANLLVDSIRAFAGSFREVPIYVVTADPARVPGTSLKGKVSRVIPLDMNERYRSFPFADKVYACAQIEQMVEKEADWLVWLNPEMLVLAEPSLVVGPPGAVAVLRPVHIRNVGSAAGERLDNFWTGIYQVAGVDPGNAWTVESFVDRQRVRAYFNSGFMGYRPSAGVLRAWRKSFETLLADDSLLSKLCPDDQHKFFVHQALLSAVTVGKLREPEVSVLPAVYGYPLLLHKSVSEERRPQSLKELVTLIHDGNLAQLLTSIPVDPPLRTWLREHGVN